MISSQYVSRVTLLRDRVGSFKRYPFSLPALRSFDQLELHPRVTFFVGENGSGKSNLLEAIAVSLGFNAEGGSKNFRFGTRRSHSEPNEYIRIAKGFKRPRDGFLNFPAQTLFPFRRAMLRWRTSSFCLQKTLFCSTACPF